MDENFRRLHEYVTQDKYLEAKLYLEDLSSILQNELSESLIDNYILNIFDESYGLLNFIQKIVNKPVYKDLISEAITACMEIIYMLVNNSPKKIEKYTPRIRDVCFKVLLTSNSKAHLKRSALKVFLLIIEKTDYFPNGFLSKEETFEKLYTYYESAKGEVLGHTIKIMGVMLKKYPCVTNNPTIIYNSIMLKLKVNIRNDSEATAKYCFFFLSAFLETYSDADLVTIYQCVKDRMSIGDRKPAQREGINLLQKHIFLFERQIHVDAEFWYNRLNSWLNTGGEYAKAAFYTLNVLYSSLSKTLAVDTPENRMVCMKFWTKFIEDIFNSRLHGYHLRLAIRGFGHFVFTAKVFLTNAELNSAIYDFINKIEQTYLINFDSKLDDIDYLPEYIQSLSNIIQHISNITEYELGILQRATVLVIKLFPQLAHHHHNMVVIPTIAAYYHVRQSRKSMATLYLLNTVREGVIYSCSHAVVSPDVEYLQNITTYRNYLPFWQNFINNPREAYSFLSVDSDVNKIQKEIFDEFIATLLYLLEKLNLNTRIAEEFSTFSDPKITLEAVKVNDFNIFVNVIDLYVDVLQFANKNLFKSWVQRFLNKIMVKSKKYPLVSGFYKLFSVGLKISNNLRYFDADRLEQEDIKLCYDTIRDSITNIISKVKLYKDDLKISCIKVILSAPVSIISEMLINVAPVMASLFTLGRSNLELAEIGMDALECWYKELKQEDFDPFLEEILPHLDSYLCSRSISEKFDAKEATITKTKKAINRRKIVTISEGDLFKIQKRILTFIGGLSNDMCRSFVENSGIIGDNLFYSKNLHLKVKLMFPNNFHVDLYLEKLILRIVELALYCSERKLRINACEVLHSLVLVFLGRTKEMSEIPKEDLHYVLKKLINALLFLGCDPDMTVQKILRPLLLQLMHWYSSKLMKLCSHTAIVVETILDGVTQTADSAVRDFSCLCIKEFVDWSIKQSSKSGIARDPINIHIILRKIKFFSSHSDPSKRSAAALIFNNIYTILREENYIFTVYWIELLYCFVMNLSMIDEYDEYNCLAQVHASLDHLQRGFVEKSHIFNSADKDRRIPPNFQNCLLTDVACWLLKQTGSPNRHCREKCYTLFKNIAPLCEKGALDDFIKYYQRTHGKKWMQELYLRNYSLKLDTKKFEGLFKWMSDFQCLLDAHIFFEQFATNALQENDVKIIQENFKAFYDTMYSYNTQKLSPMDKDYFSSLSTNIVKKYLRYALKTGLLKQQEYWNLFMKMIFENNNLLAEEIHVQEVNDFLKIMKENLLGSFISSMKLYLTQNSLEDCNLNFIVPFRQRQILKGLLILKNSCLSEKICAKQYVSNELGKLFDKMIGNNKVVVNLQNMVKEYCELKIELALKSGDIGILITYICNDTLVKVAQQRDEIEFGRYIFDTFKSTIINALIDNFDLFLKTLVIKINSNSLYFVEEVVQSLLSNQKSFDEQLYNGIARQILTNWVAFKKFYENDIEKKIKGLKLLENISFLLNDSTNADLENTEEPCLWTLQIIDYLCSTADILPHKRFEYLSSAITTLPLFLKYGKKDSTQSICERLRRIEENSFANLSKDLLIAATVFINKSFQAAISSKSKHLFNFSSKLYILLQPKDDLNIDQFCKIFMKNADTDLQLQLLRLLYTFDYSKYSLSMYYKFAREIIVNILRYAEYEIFVAFYTENISGIIHLIQKKCTNSVESAEKSVAFILTRMLFSRLNIEQDVDEVTCPITKSAYPDATDSKQLVKQVMNITSQLLKDTSVIEDETFREWDRICKCECYNALISTVCNMQREPVWYNLLFKREVKGCNYLWGNIVNEKRDYTFSIDFEKIPRKKENLVAIRSTYRAKKKQNLADTLKYIESQNILNSTITEDIVKYDFSRTILRSQEIDASPSGEGGSRVEMQVDIDGDELNSHECMLMLCGLFQFLHDEKIYNATASGVPTYIDSIRKELENEDTPRNVKLFLIKALENKQELFKPYAKGLFAPIMKAVVDGTCGDNINYFVADLIVMLVFWAEGVENIEANETASELAHFLIKNINTDRGDIMKYHVDLLKFFVEQWKQHITVPKDYLLIQLRTLAKSKKVLPIIHVCSIFLANDLPPWNDMKIFMTKLIEVLAHDSRFVYRSCAEMIGTALSYSKRNESESTLINFTKFLVKYFKHRNKKPDEKDLICLQAITKHYPEFSDHFFTSLIYEYSKYRGQYKMICLKMFLERINALHENSDFPIIKLEPLISDDSNNMKILGLEIIRKTLPVIYLSANAQARLVIKKEEFLSLLEKISRFLTSENNVCRSVTYEIFMDIYHDNRFNSHDDIKNKCKDVLLQGLVDHNEEIEEKIKEFWAKILPTNTSEKFLFLLKDMYKTSTETSYLGYCVNFMLNELALRDEYQEVMFEYDLADCIFTDYQIKDNWRERHSTLAPLFAQSYRSQTENYDSSTSTNTIDSNVMMLRATNYSMEFEPTQGNSPLEDEKQNILNEDIDSRDDEEEEEQNPEDKLFKKPWPVKLRKKRFFSDETRTVRGFALRKLEESSKVEKARTDFNKQRQQQVNIYRTYRRGDFPDIKLSVSDIITPLKVLAKHDNRIAKILYTILFEAITHKLTDNEDSFVERTIEGVKNIFEASILYDTNLIGALLDVALKHKSKYHFLPDVIAKVSFNSGLLWSGALLLEEYLVDGFDDYESDEGPAPKRSRGFLNSAEVDCWVKLADIYKELEEWDLVRAIFRYKMQSNENVIQAIVEESQSNWRDAQDLYLAAIQDNPPAETLGFYYEACYKCFAELSDWDALAKSVKQSTSIDHYWDELWDEDWHQQKLLPWFMIAQLRNSLVSEEAKVSFVSDINSALSNTDKLLYIKQNFSEEIAFLYLLTGDFDKVNYFLTNNIELFLSNWSNLSPFLISLKMKKLSKIQNSLEMYNFITKFNTFSLSNKNSILNDMCRSWLKVYNDNLTSIVSSETKTLYRTRCLSVLQTKFESADVKQRLNNVKFQLDMNLANIALRMKNFHVCRKYLTRHDWCSGEQSKDGVKYRMTRSGLLCFKASKLNFDLQLEHIVDAWQHLADCMDYTVVTENIDLYLSTNLCIYDVIQDLAQVLLNNNKSIEDEDIKQQINAITKIPPPYTSNSIGNYGFNTLQEALSYAKDIVDKKDDNNLKSIADAHYKLASFVSSYSNRQRDLIIHILNAMFYGSSEARYMFPCLLEIVDLGTVYKDTFLTEASKIPEWMFIQWIPQLLANLDTQNITAIYPIVEKLGKAYPQAIMYPYRLSKQKYSFPDSIKEYGEQAVASLDKLLEDALTEKFLTALSSVSLWYNVLSYHIKQLERACDISSDLFNERLNALKLICEEHVDYKRRDSLKGQVFKEIIGHLKTKILPLAKDKFNAKSIKTKLDQHRKSLKALANPQPKSGGSKTDSTKKLSYYSPWLENFSDNEINLNLEIPGQYKGDKMPLLKYHVIICGFSSEVSKFSSLRSPLKLTIIGSDAKEYPFLVKFGEDLRQDQRIEQIFGLMNNIFNANPVCREKRLNIRTYQVIPLTGILGLIECVTNAVTYSQFLNSTVSDFNKIQKKAKTEYNKRYLNNSDQYLESLFRHSPEPAMNLYRSIVDILPRDLFQQAIRKISVDSESYVVLRNKFITSHTVNCIADWILGIGDRHLGNSMVCLKSGQTMDIDFGFAFGLSVQIIPFPEVVPIRLTPHFLELNQPLKEHGLIEETMVHALRALRNNSTSLFSTMSVFIKEPSLEWMEFKLHENKATGYNWNPLKKLDHARRKLNGGSSVEIMSEELADRTTNKKYIDQYISFVKRNRPQFTENLSVEDQVACLIDHATDYNLLVRIYDGFEAWI